MAVWRMAFREGAGGPSLWSSHCVRLEAAVIQYDEADGVDLSRLTRADFSETFRHMNPSRRQSLEHFAFEFAPGDIIFVKEGPEIICRGRVSGRYRFVGDTDVIDGHGKRWQHHVPVEWDHSFVPVRLQLGRTQYPAVYRLTDEDVVPLVAAERLAYAEAEAVQASEGETILAEMKFRLRNRVLVEAKKRRGPLTCEACDFSFEEHYGKLAAGLIVVHHRRPMADGTRITKLEDLALLCANCHQVVHTKNPPIAVSQLREIVLTRKGGAHQNRSQNHCPNSAP